ncbi:reverse transcriptase [Caerostris extrusa]|uniref:Reverse transcriptase n=1 Tax=Caerostris extrusa TaxID=172846 RepID=A0AAV4XD83_CAEEX|nr:reverse transcriptase [Caerostris extrusa]
MPIPPQDIHKTAICTQFEFYESNMQFGLCNARNTFQSFIEEVIRGLEGVYAFINDILIVTKTHKYHIAHLTALFQRLGHYNLTLKPSKFTLGAFSLTFLEFHVSKKKGIESLRDQVEDIQNFLRPQTITQLRKFLSLYTFYRCFIPKATHISVSLVNGNNQIVSVDRLKPTFFLFHNTTVWADNKKKSSSQWLWRKQKIYLHLFGFDELPSNSGVRLNLLANLKNLPLFYEDPQAVRLLNLQLQKNILYFLCHLLINLSQVYWELLNLIGRTHRTWLRSCHREMCGIRVHKPILEKYN